MAVTVWLLAASATAQTTFYWDRNAATAGAGTGATLSGTWDTTTNNWNTNSGGTTAAEDFVSGGNAVFSAGTSAIGQTYTVTVSGTQNTSSIDVTEGTVTFTGGTINFNDATPDFTVGSGLTTTVNSLVSGTNGLTKAGDGLLIFSAANSYTGQTRVNDGILRVTNASALGTTGTVVASGAELQLSGGITVAGEALTLSGAGTSGALVNAAGNNTWDGNITLGAASTITNSVAGTTLTLGGSGNNRTLTNAGNTLTLGGAGNVLLNAQTGGTGGLVKTGTGTATLSYGGANDATLSVYSGTTQINNGTLIVDIGGDNGTPATPLNGAITVGAADGSGTSLMEVRYIQQIGDTTAVRVNKTGTFRLTSTNYSSNLNETIGALTLEGGGRVETVAGANTAQITLNGDVTRVATGNTSAVIAGSLGLGTGTRTFNVADSAAAVDLQVSAVTSGTATLAKTGAGTLELTGANTYSGGTTLSTGTLALGNNNALGSGDLDVTGGTITGTGGARAIANNVNVGGDFAIGGSQALTFNGSIDLGGATRTITVDNTALTTFAGAVTEPWYSGLTKAGAGELVLAGNNTFSAPVTVSAGTLTLAHNNALGATGTSNNVVSSGATLALQGNISVNEGSFGVGGTGAGGAGAIRNVSGNNTLGGTINLQSDTSIVSTTGSLTFTGDLAANNNLTTSGAGNITFSGGGYGSGNITQNGSGTLTFAGSASTSFGGALSINDGTVVLAKTGGVTAVASSAINIGNGSGAASSAVLRLDGNNQIADYAGLITIAADGSLNLNGFTEKVNSVTSTGNINLGTGALTVGVSSGNVSLGGTVTGAGTLIKEGSGTLALLSSIVLSGELQLNAGTLALSGYNLTANTLHITGNSTIDFAGGNSTISLTNFIIDAGVTLTVQNWASAADYFYTQGWSGAAFDTKGAAPMNQVVFSGYDSAHTHWQSHDNQITPVPEPSTYGIMMMLGAGGLGVWRRWRKRSNP